MHKVEAVVPGIREREDGAEGEGDVGGVGGGGWEAADVDVDAVEDGGGRERGG